jgi:hypothetical protein
LSPKSGSVIRKDSEGQTRYGIGGLAQSSGNLAMNQDSASAKISEHLLAKQSLRVGVCVC